MVKLLCFTHWVYNITAPSSEGDWALVNIYHGHSVFFPSLFSGSFHTYLNSLPRCFSDWSQPFHTFSLFDAKRLREPTHNKSVELGMHFWIGFIPGSVYVPTFIFPLLHLTCLFPPHTFSCISYLLPSRALFFQPLFPGLIIFLQSPSYCSHGGLSRIHHPELLGIGKLMRMWRKWIGLGYMVSAYLKKKHKIIKSQLKISIYYKCGRKGVNSLSL